MRLKNIKGLSKLFKLKNINLNGCEYLHNIFGLKNKAEQKS